MTVRIRPESVELPSTTSIDITWACDEIAVAALIEGVQLELETDDDAKV